MNHRSLLWMLFAMAYATPSVAQDFSVSSEGTFSIIARDPATGQLGMGVTSKTVATGARSRGGKGGVAVIAHQSASNPMYGTIGIELLEAGMTPQEALEMMLRSDEGRDSRQVAIVDIQGRTAAWTSPTITDWKGHHCGVNYCAQGNTLAGPGVVEGMVKSFESSSGPLAERLLDALDAGQAAGGDKRGRQSAALLILKPLTQAGFGDRELDLRADEHTTPLVELRRVLRAFRSREAVSEVGNKLRSNDLKGALEKAIGARDIYPENDDAWVAIAEVNVRMGRKAEALEAVRRAVGLNESNKRLLSANKSFASLFEDPEFLRLVK